MKLTLLSTLFDKENLCICFINKENYILSLFVTKLTLQIIQVYSSCDFILKNVYLQSEIQLNYV